MLFRSGSIVPAGTVLCGSCHGYRMDHEPRAVLAALDAIERIRIANGSRWIKPRVRAPRLRPRKRKPPRVTKEADRAKLLAQIASRPERYTVCHGCGCILTRDSIVCPQCDGYRMLADRGAVLEAVARLTLRRPVSVSASDLEAFLTSEKKPAWGPKQLGSP